MVVNSLSTLKMDRNKLNNVAKATNEKKSGGAFQEEEGDGDAEEAG